MSLATPVIKNQREAFVQGDTSLRVDFYNIDLTVNNYENYQIVYKVINNEKNTYLLHISDIVLDSNNYYFNILYNDFSNDAVNFKIQAALVEKPGSELNQLEQWFNNITTIKSNFSDSAIRTRIKPINITEAKLNDSSLSIDETTTISALYDVNFQMVLDFNTADVSYPVKEDKLLYYTIKLNDNIVAEKIYPKVENRIDYIFKNNFNNNTSYELTILGKTVLGYYFSKTYNIRIQIDTSSITSNIITKPLLNFACNQFIVQGSINENWPIGEYRFLAIKNENHKDVIVSQTIVKKNTTANDSAEIKYDLYDSLISSGISASYRLEIYHNNKIYKTTASTPIVNNFEDIILMEDIENFFHIKYDPDISSLKYNTQDTITPTLGGKYPHVRRNGNMFYKTFNIGGLISYNTEYDYDLQTNLPDSVAGDTVLNNNVAPSLTPSRFFSDISNTDWNNLDELTKERLFREALISFLYNDKVKLFKSPTEGNMLIRLTNIQLTPKKELGRMIYSFSAQATEVAEATYENLQKYGIQREPEVSITDVSVV